MPEKTLRFGCNPDTFEGRSDDAVERHQFPSNGLKGLDLGANTHGYCQ